VRTASRVGVDASAARTQLGKLGKIGHLAVNGIRVEFEIAGMDDGAERRRDGQRHAVHHRVRHMNELDAKGSSLHHLLRLDPLKSRLKWQLVLVQPALDQRQREGCAVDRHIELGQEVRDRPDVILVGMRQEQRPHAIAIFHQVREIRRDDIDAQQLGFGKHHAAIDDDDVVAIAQRHDVHAELAEPAQRDQAERTVGAQTFHPYI
jgi:hypothetical protein